MRHILERLMHGTDVFGYLVRNDDNKTAFISADEAAKYTYSNASVCDNAVIPTDTAFQDKLVYDTSAWNGQKEGYFLLYHGSPNKEFTPIYGYGEDKHDYGKGFYLTPYPELAKEWSVCTGAEVGFLHTYLLRLDNLNILNFNSLSELAWMAELMKHRDADTGARYRRFAPRFIEQYSVDTSGYDVIYGWRADSSYFNIAKRFVRDEIDYDLIGELFKLGDLENQICLKSKAAFDGILEISCAQQVDTDYLAKYKNRDAGARSQMNSLIESPRNTMTHTFSSLIK